MACSRRNSSNRNENGELNRNSNSRRLWLCQSRSSQPAEASSRLSDDSSSCPDNTSKYLFTLRIIYIKCKLYVLGAPLITPSTFAKQVTLEKRIGVGGYGTVYRGIWHQDTIAIKIFLSSEEPSWSREVYIYKTIGLNHENILRFIAADNIVNISKRLIYFCINSFEYIVHMQFKHTL